MLDEHNPDIVMVTETWLDPSIPSSDIIPTNYSVYRKDRQAGQTGGGVMIAVCNNLLSSACPDLDTDCELVWAKIDFWVLEISTSEHTTDLRLQTTLYLD